MPKQKVLIPLDGSDFSRQIFTHVLKFIHPADSDLTLLRVAPPPSGEVPGPMRPASTDDLTPMFESDTDATRAKHPVYASQERDSLVAALQNELQVDMVRLQDAGYSVSIAIHFGHPAEEIIRFVEQENVALVAMTTHGRTGLRRLLFGSVAQEVMQSVKVPVMLLRPTGEAANDPGNLKLSAGVG